MKRIAALLVVQTLFLFALSAAGASTRLAIGTFGLTDVTPLPGAETQTNHSAIRLGLIVEEPSALELSDILTAELSKQPEVQLLERAEISKVYGEQQLLSGQGDYLKLGQVLGADGLLLMQLLKEGTNQFLFLQLVAVKPGVLISANRFPWPISERLQWATWVCRRLAPQFPKLGVLRQDALPISVVNVRSAVRSRQAQDQEQQLTALTIERLLREPQLFVLERRRMEFLSEEKDLKGLRDSAFWNGSFLLDAVADRDGYSSDTLTVSARLLPPTGRPPISIEVKGSRTNLQGVVEQLAQKVKQNLNLRNLAGAWKPAEEAERYFEEAKWAFKWNMLSEARSACESSWSLGKQNKEAAELRIRIYGALARSIQNDSLAMKPTRPEYAPDISKLDPAIHALELYHEGFRTFLATGTKPETNWYELALSLLIADSDLLRRAYYHREACRGQEERFGDLRRLARELAATVQQHAPYQSFSLRNHWVFFWGRKESVGTENPDLMQVEAAVGGFWHETPDESLKMYRRLARAGLLHRQRGLFASPMLAAWKTGDEKRGRDLWSAFIQELLSSTNALDKVEGNYLALADVKPGPGTDCQERKHLLFQVAIQNAAALESAGLAEGLDRNIEGLIGNIAVATPGNPVDYEYYKGFRPEFNEARQRKGWQNKSSVQVPSAQSAQNISLRTMPTPSASFQSSSSNRLARFWSLPLAMFDSTADGAETSILHGCYREGKLWLEVRKNSHTPKIFVFAVDLNTFNYETVELPLDRITPNGAFEVLRGHLYISGPEKIYRYAMEKRQWDEFPVPVQGNLRLSLASERLFVSTLDTIMALDENGTTRLLASTRRRPAMNLLDSLDSYSIINYDRHNPSIIFPGPRQSMRTLIDGKLYACEHGSNQWAQIAEFPPSPNMPAFTIFPTGCVFRQVTGDQQQRWWSLAKDQSTLELLLAGTNPADGPSKPRWLIPSGLSFAPSRWHWDGEDLWVMAGELNLETDASGGGVLHEEGGRHALLLHFQKDQPKAQVTPIWFDLKDKGYFGSLSSKLLGIQYPTPQGYKHRSRIGQGIFEGTPHGFIVTGDVVPGFWLIPRTDSVATQVASQPRNQSLDPDKSLLSATELGDVKSAKEALAQGAAVDARNERGWTPLIIAGRTGNLELAKLLVERGANITTKSTAKFGASVLCFAIEGNNPEIVKLLIEKGADPNARSGEYDATPLYVAAMLGRKQAAEVLLLRGAKVSEMGATDKWQRTYTPLMGAACTEHPELVELLLAHGAQLEQRNSSGGTALVEAAKTRSLNTIRVLISKGADVMARDSDGYSALRCAVYQGRKETVTLLLEAGADPGDVTIGAKFTEKRFDPEMLKVERDYPEIIALLTEAQSRNGPRSSGP